MKKFALLLITAVLLICVSAACLLAGCSQAKPLPEEVTLPEVLEKGGYELVWGDEFDGDEIDYTKWRVGYNGGVRRAGYYVDTSDIVFVKDGALTIRTLYMEDGVYVPAGIRRGWTALPPIPRATESSTAKIIRVFRVNTAITRYAASRPLRTEYGRRSG